MTSPRLSLWLIPPESSSTLNSKLQDLINTQIPALFPGEKVPKFIPHITLASGITLGSDTDDDSVNSLRGISPQVWLFSENLSSGVGHLNPQVTFINGVSTGETFTKKVFVRCGKEELRLLVAWVVTVLRSGSVRKAGEFVYGGDWDPHLSLLYYEGKVSEEKRGEIEKLVVEEDIDLGIGDGEFGGWSGGSMLLVNTSKAVEEWEVLARRDLS